MQWVDTKNVPPIPEEVLKCSSFYVNYTRHGLLSSKYRKLYYVPDDWSKFTLVAKGYHNINSLTSNNKLLNFLDIESKDLYTFKVDDFPEQINNVPYTKIFFGFRDSDDALNFKLSDTLVNAINGIHS